MRSIVPYLVIFAAFVAGGALLIPQRHENGNGPAAAEAIRWPAIQLAGGSVLDPSGAWSPDDLLEPRTAGEEAALRDKSLSQRERRTLLRRPPKAWSDLPSRYDLSLTLSLPRMSEMPAARKRLRVLFDYQDPENFYYAEFSTHGTWLGRVEGGMDVTLSGSSRSLKAGRQQRLKIKRRELTMVALIDGHFAGVAYDATFHGGRAAIVRPDRDVVIRRLRRQGIERTLSFADDFMRAPDEPGAWVELSGLWLTKSLRNPSLSANAFTYMGAGRDAVALAGYTFWDAYRMRVSARGPAGDAAMGVVFAHRNPKNYFLFRWTSRSAPEKLDGQRQIIRVADGKETVLATGAGGYIPGQWYRLEVRLGVGSAAVLVDGHELLRARASDLIEGRIGLYADTPADENEKPDTNPADVVSFDDVVVDSITSYEDSFDDEYVLRRWQHRGGDWEQVVLPVGADAAAGPQGLLRAHFPQGEGRLIFGRREWGNYRFAVDVVGGQGEAGLVFNYRDELNYHRFSVDLKTGAATLVQLDEGTESVLDEASVNVSLPLRLEIRTDRGHVAAYIGTRRVLDGWDAKRSSGRPGLYARRPQAVDFDNAAITFETNLNPVISENALFAQEVSMMSWAGDLSEWKRGGDYQGAAVWWHRARFPGDTALVAQIQKYTRPVAVVALSLAKSGRSRDGNGYVFTVKSTVEALEPPAANSAANETATETATETAQREREPGEGKPSQAAAQVKQPPPAKPRHTLHLTLSRQGEEVQRRELTVTERPRNLAIRRAGSYVIGYVDGTAQLVYHDAHPLRDSRLAYAAKGVVMPQKSILVYNNHVFNERFSQAPSDWRIGAGFWEITNRWQCDPRWSFFSGRSFSSRDGARDHLRTAVLWSKRLFDGDVTIEMFAAPMMVLKLGGKYAHARDINITLCADGKDLSSGYTCSFGAHDNKYSAIYRKGEEVATDITGRILRSGTIHRYWHYVRVQRTGDFIHMEVWQCPEYPKEWKLKTSLTFKDPDPLENKHVAIWTYGTGIMISRVRISGPSGQVLESPDLAPRPQVRTFYDLVSE